MAGLFDYEFQLDEIKKHQQPLQKLNEIIKRIKSLTGLLNLTYNLLRYEQLVRLKNIPIMKS